MNRGNKMLLFEIVLPSISGFCTGYFFNLLFMLLLIPTFLWLTFFKYK